MSTLVAVVFNDEHTAFAMRAELARMQKELLIELEDAVVVTRDQNGKTKLDQAVNLTSAGALGGGFWGMLIGMIFLNPLLGFALGAGAGALSGKFSDIGLDDKMMKDLASVVQARLFRALRDRAKGDDRQGSRRPETVCRQGQGLPVVAQQGRRSGVAGCARSRSDDSAVIDVVWSPEFVFRGTLKG